MIILDLLRASTRSSSGFRIGTSFLFLIVSVQCAVSQEVSPTNVQRITWVTQFPFSAGDTITRKKQKFIDLIFGKKQTIQLERPVNVIADSLEHYWILDQENGYIFQVKDGVGEIPHIKSKLFKVLPSIVGCCFFPDSRILLTDSYLNKILLFSPGKKEISNLNDSLLLKQPTGIAFSEVTREIWVVETAQHSISVLNEKGVLKRRIGSRGTTPGKFNFPTSLWIDHLGNAYIVDALNFRIQVFDKSDSLISCFGKNGDGGGNFARPKGIATDSFGNIYVVDALFNAVQIFDLSGKFLYTFGSQGHGKGEFWMPSGIYIDEKNYIYVADCYNSRVQVFHLNK